MATNVRDVLLAPRLAPGRAESLLAPYGFRDPAAAERNLQAIAADPAARSLLAEVLDRLLRGLADSADPDVALNHFERLIRAGGSPPALLSHLRAQPRAVELLAKTLGASSFMAEILIRHPSWFYWVSDPERLSRPRRREEIEGDLAAALAGIHAEARQRDLLRIARRREILQIGIRDLLRLASVADTTAALSALADALIGKAAETAAAALASELALPSTGAGPLSAFTILSLGKLGGGELNFSSDVDLMFLYGSDRGRMARGPSAPSRPAFYASLARRIVAALNEVSEEGYVYRVDLRLRPEGGAGPLAQSLAGAAAYYGARGATWERLVLLKARPVAGSLPLGQRFLKRVRPFVYGRPFAAEAVAELSRLKRGIDRKVALRGETQHDVKLGTGGIREVELVTQALQIRHGGRHPRLRARNTVSALEALAERRLIAEDEHAILARAYLFFRDVENKLQMVADAQTHSLPREQDELRRCALRLGYRGAAGEAPGAALLSDLKVHREATHHIFEAMFERGELLREGPVR